MAVERRVGLRLAATHATTTARDVVDVAWNLGGGSSIYASSPLERRFRDVHVATQHMLVAPASLELRAGCCWTADRHQPAVTGRFEGLPARPRGTTTPPCRRRGVVTLRLSAWPSHAAADSGPGGDGDYIAGRGAPRRDPRGRPTRITHMMSKQMELA